MKFLLRSPCVALLLSSSVQCASAFGLPRPQFHAPTGLSSATLSTPSTTGTEGVDELPSIVPFGGSAPPQAKPDKQVVGGKGLGLQEMSRIGVDVPPGFTLTTKLCQSFEKAGDLSEEMWAEVKTSVERIEKDTGKGYGNPENPLLFSCRSGAAISMPGMMDTVLNIVCILSSMAVTTIRC